MKHATFKAWRMERRTGIDEIWAMARRRELMAERLGCKPETVAMLRALSALAMNTIVILDENQRRNHIRQVHKKYLKGEL